MPPLEGAHETHRRARPRAQTSRALTDSIPTWDTRLRAKSSARGLRATGEPPNRRLRRLRGSRYPRPPRPLCTRDSTRSSRPSRPGR